MQGIDTRISFLAMVRRHWLVMALGYCLALIDPFGVNSRTSQAISDAFDRMFSPRYTAKLSGKTSSETGDLVDVILIDDLSIRMLSSEDYGYLRANDWPLAYSDHYIVIDALRRLGYGTVILDLTFYRARQHDESFQILVHRLKYLRENTDLAVILGAGENPEQLEPSIQPLVDAVYGVGLVGWSGYGSNYPIGLELNDGTTSLAVSGYNAYCRNRKCEDLKYADDAWFVPEASGMHISWSLPAQRMSHSVSGCVTEQIDNSVLIVLKNLFRAERVSPSPNRKPVCPPLPTATLSDVLVAGPDQDDFFSEEPLEERIAMVGVSLPSARDLFDPPIRGLLPGVYLHAEALRNLLHYGPDYLKPLGIQLKLDPPGLSAWSIPVDLILAWPLLLWGVVFATRVTFSWLWNRQSLAEWPEVIVEIIEIAAIVAWLCLVYRVALYCNRTPGFLVELIVLTPMLFIAARTERKEMENERTTIALAACSAVQFGIGRNHPN